MIPKFHFVFELLPFIKDLAIQYWNNHYKRLCKAILNGLVYSHGLPKGQMWYHVKDYHSFFWYPDIMES